MSDTHYQFGRGKKEKRRSKLKVLIFWLIFLAILAGVVWYLVGMLKPETKLSQAPVKVTKLNYAGEAKSKRYDEGNFVIELPSSWQKQPAIKSSYNRYAWKNINSHMNSEELTIYEDTIPQKFAVNRAVIVRSQGAHMTLEGAMSDNCSKYTKSSPDYENRAGAPAKWEGVDFLCDQANKSRDVIGTSSEDGVNTVVMTGSNGVKHKYFFTYTNNSINGNYDALTAMISSFRMK